MNAVCLYYLHVLEETAATGFKPGESLRLPQFDGLTIPQHHIIMAKTVP